MCCKRMERNFVWFIILWMRFAVCLLYLYIHIPLRNILANLSLFNQKIFITFFSQSFELVKMVFSDELLLFVFVNCFGAFDVPICVRYSYMCRTYVTIYQPFTCLCIVKVKTQVINTAELSTLYSIHNMCQNRWIKGDCKLIWRIFVYYVSAFKYVYRHIYF